MLSLKELKRATGIAKPLLEGARLKRVDQPDDCTLVFTFDTDSGKHPLLLSCHQHYARLCLEEFSEPAGSDKYFPQYMRARWIGSRLVEMEADENDRLTIMRLASREDSCAVIFSILGARSNIYLLDAGGKLVHALRSLERTRRELAIGEAWIPPRSAVITEGEDRWAEIADDCYLQEIAAVYSQMERLGDAEAQARRIMQALKKENTSLDRKRINLHEDLGKARQAETDRRLGELLKNILHTVKSGDKTASAVDYETGEKVNIPLNERLSPSANLAAYFARYQKEQRGEQRILEQLEELDALRQTLADIEVRLKTAMESDVPDKAILEEIEELPPIRRALSRLPSVQKQSPPPNGKKPAEKKELPAKLRPKRYRTEEGFEIWVGRNDEGNDYLSTRLARGNDMFFHLEGYPGSHVVLRTEGGADVSDQSILDACELAVHFSKMKNAGTVDVHVAPIKNVKKPKGAKPGLVYVRSGKSIRLRRDAKRLQRILASRLDE